MNRGEQTLLVGWIAIAAVVLEAVALAAGVVVWGVPALIVVGPLLLASVIVTVVLWATVVPHRLLRAHLEGRVPPGAPAGWRAAQNPHGSRSGSGSDSAGSGSAWPSDSGFAADHATPGWHGATGSGWSGDSTAGDGASSGSWPTAARPTPRPAPRTARRRVRPTARRARGSPPGRDRRRAGDRT